MQGGTDMVRNYERWLTDEGGIACLYSTGIFSRAGVVPEGVRGFDFADRDGQLAAGSPLEGDALLVRDSHVPVPICVDKLRDRDGINGALTATLYVEPPRTRTAALLLRDAFLKKEDYVDSASLAQYLAPSLRSGLLKILLDRPWAGEEGLLGGLMAFVAADACLIVATFAPLLIDSGVAFLVALDTFDGSIRQPLGGLGCGDGHRGEEGNRHADAAFSETAVFYCYSHGIQLLLYS